MLLLRPNLRSKSHSHNLFIFLRFSFKVLRNMMILRRTFFKSLSCYSINTARALSSNLVPPDDRCVQAVTEDIDLQYFQHGSTPLLTCVLVLVPAPASANVSCHHLIWFSRSRIHTIRCANISPRLVLYLSSHIASANLANHDGIIHVWCYVNRFQKLSYQKDGEYDPLQ